MASNILDILIRAKDDASAVLENVRSRISGLGQEGPSAFSKMDTAATALHGKFQALQMVVTAVVAGIASSKLVQVPAQFESLTKQLETVTKSGTKAKESMVWVEEFAAKTPNELGEVANAFAKLSSYGFDPKTILTPIGNAAAGMQKTLDQAVEAFADATRGEFERLKEFGLNAETVGNQVTFRWMENGLQMQKTVAKNADAISKALSGIWGGMFAGGMDAQMTTFSGRWSNLMDTVTRAINKFMGAGPFEWLKQKIGEVTEALARLESSGKLEEWGRNSVKWLQLVWDIIKTGFTHIVDFVDKWSSLLVVLGTVAAYAKAETALVKLFSALTKTRLGLVGLLIAIPDLMDAVTDIGARLYANLAPWSDYQKLMKQAERQQKANAAAAKELDERIIAEQAALGNVVTGFDDWAKQVAAGTIRLKGHAGQVALTGEEYKALAEQVKKAGEAGARYVGQVGDRYDFEAKQAKALAETEGAAAAVGLAVARDKYNGVLAAAKAVAAAQMQLVDQAAGTEQQKAGLRRQIEESLQKAKTEALKGWLESLKSGLDEAVAQEKRYHDQSIAARESTEEKVRALRRKGMSEFLANLDEERQAEEYNDKARAALAEGTAQGLDKAYKWAEKARAIYESLGNSVKNVEEYGGGGLVALQKYTAGVAESGKIMEEAAKKGEAAFADLAKTLQQQIQEAKAALDELGRTPLSLAVNVDTKEVDAKLDELSGRKTTSAHTVDPNTDDAFAAIAELKRPTSSTHTVYVRQVEQRAAGGSIGRDVPAMVMPGEVIFDPETAGRFAPLLSAVNALRAPVAAFADGGPVFRPFRRGLVPGVGDEDSEPVLLQEGSFVVRKAAVAKYGPLLDAIQAGRVGAYAAGGIVLPEWLRRLRGEAPAPAEPVAPTPLSVSLAAPAAFRAMTTPMAGPAGGMTARGAAAVSRLDGLRQSGALKFASGGSLDETLADIALERRRTQQDYDEAVADAKASHDDGLAALLAQERDDLDAIAATLADTLSQLQAALSEAQDAYASAMAEAETAKKEADAAAQTDYAESAADEKKDWDEKKAELAAAVTEAQAAYAKWKKKGVDEKPGFGVSTFSASNGLIHNFSGTKEVVWKDESDAGKKALADYEKEGRELRQEVADAQKALSDLGNFQVSDDTSKGLADALAEAKADLADAQDSAKDDYKSAMSDDAAGKAEAAAQAAADTATAQDQAKADAAELEKTLADTLADLKKDFDRAMEDLAIEEARARANADETKGYTVSGFSQWLRDGGPVSLANLRRYAAGGFVGAPGLLGRLARFADGGQVPAVPGSVPGQDSVLAALTPGEGVINPQAMSRLISSRALAALNNLDYLDFLDELPRYRAGGVVGEAKAAKEAVAGLSSSSAGTGGGEGYSATLTLALGGKTFAAKTTASTLRDLVKEARRHGGNVK